MKVIIITNKNTYKYKHVNDCRKEIADRTHIYTGPLVPLIIRAFNSETEVLKNVYADRVILLWEKFLK